MTQAQYDLVKVYIRRFLITPRPVGEKIRHRSPTIEEVRKVFPFIQTAEANKLSAGKQSRK